MDIQKENKELKNKLSGKDDTIISFHDTISQLRVDCKFHKNNSAYFENMLNTVSNELVDCRDQRNRLQNDHNVQHKLLQSEKTELQTSYLREKDSSEFYHSFFQSIVHKTKN